MTSQAQLLTIGLTGGIAAGKTLVSDRLAELGASVIDTDVVAREVVAPGSAGLKAIRDAFGEHFLNPDGSLNRGAMREHVFADNAARRKLEAITHPLIGERCETLANDADGVYLIYAVPLLVGSRLRERMDRVLVVDCNEGMQLLRLMNRDDETAEQAAKIIAAQASREQRLAIADDVVGNHGDIAALTDATTRLHHFYVWLAQHR